jgi:hypothetical protein
VLVASAGSAFLKFLIGPGAILWCIGVLVISKTRRRRNTAAASLTVMILFYLFTLH